MKASISACIFPSCPKCMHSMGAAPWLGPAEDSGSRWDPMKSRVVCCVNQKCELHAVRYVMQPMLIDLAREDAPQ